MTRYLFTASLIVTLTACLLTSCGQPPGGDSSQPKAAIVDQLHLLEANPDFVIRTTTILESQGFKVDLWQGQQITVDFYQQLPKLGYKLIIFRVHSGLLLALVHAHEAVPSKTSYLFTGETYTTTKYITEQLNDKVSNALMSEDYPLVFAVNSGFIKDDTEGNFDNTAIIAMGCESLYFNDMAEAFTQKGASVYLGWSDVVSLEHTDNSTLNLLENLFSENTTIEQSMTQTMTEVGYDPYFNSYLKYHPAGSGGYTLKELLSRVN